MGKGKGIKILNLSDKITFGKYKGYRVSEVIGEEANNDYNWFKWINSRFKSLKISFHSSVYKAAYRCIKIKFKNSFYNILEKCVESEDETINFIATNLIDCTNLFRNTSMTNIGWDKKKSIVTFSDPLKNNKNEIKLGKFITIFLKNNYSAFTSREIEIFVNYFKGISKTNDNEKFEISDKILETYNQQVYSNTGSLGGSCMQNYNDGNDEDVKKMFSFYEKNNIKILTLIENGKLKGRALLWEVFFPHLNETKTFMDRIYSISNIVESKFFKYAEENDYVIKSVQSYSKPYGFKYKGKIFTDNIKYKLNFLPEKYPFIDTFKELKGKYIHNNSEDNRTNYYIYFTHTDGDFYVDDDVHQYDDTIYINGKTYNNIFDYFENYN